MGTPLELANNSQQLLEKGNDAIYNLNQYEPKLSNSNLCPIWELTALCHHMHPAVRSFAKELFEKFTRILAHKMHEFTPKSGKHSDEMSKNELINSYLAGDGFIAVYKKHAGVKESKKEDEKIEYAEDAVEEDLDEDNDEDAFLADKAMFSWLKSHYGGDIPEDVDNNEEEYDYSDFYKEIFDNEEEEKEQMAKEEEFKEKEREKREMEEEEVSDVDVYVSDIDRDDGEDEEIMNRMEDEMALDELQMIFQKMWIIM